MYVQRNTEVRSGKNGDMEKFNITYTEYVCVCVCTLMYPAYKAHEMCYVSTGCVSASN